MRSSVQYVVTDEHRDASFEQRLGLEHGGSGRVARDLDAHDLFTR
jgi:hypothetical protein